MPPLGANKQFLAALSKYAGQAFTADVEWTARSNKNKTRYIYDAEGKVVEDPSGQKGSGKNWYQSDLKREKKDENGNILERFGDQQPDGSVEAMRCFATLTRFAAYKAKA
jgi:hypothetical protein